jgi:hypothetical protein
MNHLHLHTYLHHPTPHMILSHIPMRTVLLVIAFACVAWLVSCSFALITPCCSPRARSPTSATNSAAASYWTWSGSTTKIVGLVDCAWTTTAEVINEVGMGGGIISSVRKTERILLRASEPSEMISWRKILFVFMSFNALLLFHVHPTVELPLMCAL